MNSAKWTTLALIAAVACVIMLALTDCDMARLPAVRRAPLAAPTATLHSTQGSTHAALRSPTIIAVAPNVPTSLPPVRPAGSKMPNNPPPYVPKLAPRSHDNTPSSGAAPGAALGSDTIEVHYIDVGQGDTILILAPGGVATLIDGGYGGMGTLEYLQAHGVKRISLMVATHPHADHIGGLIDVLRAIPVDEVVTNGYSHTTQVYEQFLDAIAQAKAQYREVYRGDSLQAGNLTFQVLNPGRDETGLSLNDSSLVLRLAYGLTSFLFTGDAERLADSSMVQAGQPLQATILKVGHHGSYTSSTPEFLRAVQPRVAIYSAGTGNPYGHPHASTIDALARVGAAIYGTDVNGTVIVTADSQSYSIKTSRGSGSRAPPTARPQPTLLPTDPQDALQPTPVYTIQPVEPLHGGTPQANGTAVLHAEESATDLPLELVSLTSPAGRNSQARLVIRAEPGSYCTITVLYKSGPSVARGLGPQVADAQGNVSWSWKVGGNTTKGIWRIVVSTSKGVKSASKEIPFEVR